MDLQMASCPGNEGTTPFASAPVMVDNSVPNIACVIFIPFAH